MTHVSYDTAAPRRASRPLTIKTIENLKPGATRRNIPDGDVRGLYLQIFPSGKASGGRYRFGGRTRKLTIGASPEIGLKDARDLRGRPTFKSPAAKTREPPSKPPARPPRRCPRATWLRRSRRNFWRGTSRTFRRRRASKSGGSLRKKSSPPSADDGYRKLNGPT